MITGLVIGVLITICALLLYDKFKKPIKVEEKHVVIDDRTREEIMKEKEFKDHYENMMNFTANKAYQHTGGSN